MRNLKYLFFILLISSCNKESFNEKSIIYEGKGIDNFDIHFLSTDQAKKNINDTYKLIHHNHYSTEIFYENSGISFYYLKSKPNKIFSISTNKNFIGKTSYGFEMNKMTVKELFKIYGKPRWHQFYPNQTVSAHYDDLGIYFNIKGLDSIPYNFDFSSSANLKTKEIMDKYYSEKYKNQQVQEICVGISNSAF